MSGETGGREALRVENLSAGYRDRPVLRDLCFQAGEGEFLVLAGPNGSGKTTLLKTIAGLVKPLSGRVFIRGRDTAGLRNRDRAALAAFLFQENGPRWPFTVEELAGQGRFPQPPAGGTALKDALSEAGLEGFEGRLITELSGGEYQRVLIARALFQGAPLLLLDEPANNLDPKYQLLVMDLLKSLTRRGLTALLSLHDLNLAALYADRIALIARGGIAALGPPAEVLRREVLEPVFGFPLETFPHPADPALPLVFPVISLTEAQSHGERRKIH